VNLKLQDALAAVERLDQVMDLEQEPLGDGEESMVTGVREGIELHGVRFRYGSGGYALEQTSLRIPAGKTVAIVGESGSGKSTLLKLLMRFHEPTEGRITIDQVDLREVGLASLRRRIGYVSQDPFIFNGTIAENIALGRPGATRDEVIEAAHSAGLGEFIAGLPEQYETITSERASNLSGGQRQRLAIARALVRRPEVLLFDEATSHLDSATERSIQESLKAALSGRTVVLVAHRLSTIKNADLICVLDRGRVVEEGTHRQLMARKGWYWAFWRAQTDGEERSAILPMAIASADDHTSFGAASRG
jgi:ATP-binding cassette subfamily B protein